MDPQESGELEAGHGLRGDVNFSGGRPVTLIEQEVFRRVSAELGQAVDPVHRRANLMVSGLSLEESRGKVLEVGSCRIRIRGETRPCHVMDEAVPGLRQALAPRWGGGAFGDVLEGGTIRVGDAVRWLTGDAHEPA